VNFAEEVTAANSRGSRRPRRPEIFWHKVPPEVPPAVSDQTRFNYDRSVGDRIVTWPNALSAARLAGVPVFLWLVLGPRTATADIIAAGLLGLAGISDWLDGKLARMLNQTSRLGQLLDPLADRLYIGATIIALGVRGIIPWWLFGVILARELVVSLALFGVLRRLTDYDALQVSFVGKAATLCLMYAFPLLFLGAHGGITAEIVRIVGWAFAGWGVALYWWAALLYLSEIRDLVKGAATS
jgi:cardiolipin synthase (CMP-forming)